MRESIQRLSHASWLYPLKGIYYFATHRFLWPLFQGRLVVILLLSLFVTINLFVWSFPPQWLFLKLWQGKSAALNATFLVLGEAAAITAILFEIFFVDETQVDIFDAVLIHEGHADLIARGRMLQPASAGASVDGEQDAAATSSSPVQRLGKHSISAVYSPFSLRQIAEFILFLPLNFIPYVGVPIFLVLTGHRAGPLHHWRYFRLQGWDKKQRRQYVKSKNLSYTWFGTVGMILQLVPVLSMVFLCTTTAGSALWAARMEDLRKDKVQSGDVGPAEGREEAYSDDPV